MKKKIILSLIINFWIIFEKQSIKFCWTQFSEINLNQKKKKKKKFLIVAIAIVALVISQIDYPTMRVI